MVITNKPKHSLPKFRERAVCMIQKNRNHQLLYSAMLLIASKLDIGPDMLSEWVRLNERANAFVTGYRLDRKKSMQMEH